MEEIIDVSVPLKPDMPIWPGSTGFRLDRYMSMEEGDFFNASCLHCDVHTGTHVDAPRHFLKNGLTLEQLPLELFIGPAVVAGLANISVITTHDLANLALPTNTSRLLLKTRNSDLWASEVSEFRKDFVALSIDAAHWIVANGIRLIGMDYLSVQRYEDDPAIHRILLEAGIVIVEGLNLANVSPGNYELICLPISLVNAEGAPARAVLRRISADTQKKSACLERSEE